MVRYKQTARRGAYTPQARAMVRSLYGAPPPARVRRIVSEDSRVVGPIVISSDDEEIAHAVPPDPSGDPVLAEFIRRLQSEEIDRPHQPSQHADVSAPPIQPVGPSAPTSDPSPICCNDPLQQIRQELAELRREINALHAEIAEIVQSNSCG